jgi:hypothetical protein
MSGFGEADVPRLRHAILEMLLRNRFEGEHKERLVALAWEMTVDRNWMAEAERRVRAQHDWLLEG